MAANPTSNVNSSPNAVELPTKPPPAAGQPDGNNGDRAGNSLLSHPSAKQPEAKQSEEKAAISMSSAAPGKLSTKSLALNSSSSSQASPSAIVLVAIAILLIGAILNNTWIGLAGAMIALLVSLRIVWVPLRPILTELVSEQDRAILIGGLGSSIAFLYLLKLLGFGRFLELLYHRLNWDAVGALGEVFGAVGQILIAVLAVYIAWRQYVIEKDLTIQQNLITQQQTIDSFFQGISDLVLDDEGLLEDWPQERAIAQGRTAAILSSVDSGGKAKIIRFLSSARLLSPLRRDQRLGRAILDGIGGYEEDRADGVRVIDLGVMLAGANLSGSDLRWTDLSEANLIRANLSGCDLVKTNLSRAVLSGTQFQGSNLNGTRFFYGEVEAATPRSQTEPPDYETGVHTGAVIENVDFTGVTSLSEAQRYYCCAWGGSTTRSTIPGGCEGIPNKLGR